MSINNALAIIGQTMNAPDFTWSECEYGSLDKHITSGCFPKPASIDTSVFLETDAEMAIRVFKNIFINLNIDDADFKTLEEIIASTKSAGFIPYYHHTMHTLLLLNDSTVIVLLAKAYTEHDVYRKLSAKDNNSFDDTARMVLELILNEDMEHSLCLESNPDKENFNLIFVKDTTIKFTEFDNIVGLMEFYNDHFSGSGWDNLRTSLVGAIQRTVSKEFTIHWQYDKPSLFALIEGVGYLYFSTEKKTDSKLQ